MDKISEQKIKELLGTKRLVGDGFISGGLLNKGGKFETDHGYVFIKKNSTPQTKLMFYAEMASLTEIANTKTLRVPNTFGIVEGPNNTFFFVMEFMEMKSLQKFMFTAGEQLAKMHLYNENVAKNEPQGKYVSQFGFWGTNCVGIHPVDNTWADDWPTFYTRRLEEQIQRVQTNRNDKLSEPLWAQLKPLIPRFFENIEIRPSLLHGDLWSGNIGEIDTGPVVFDPACLYGHHEFDLALVTVFGGFGRKFNEGYHALIPRAPGFKAREKLYHLFHMLNHWVHFGGSYKGKSISLFEALIRTKFPLE